MHALKQRMAKFAFDVNAPAGPRLVVLARDIATGSANSFILVEESEIVSHLWKFVNFILVEESEIVSHLWKFVSQLCSCRGKRHGAVQPAQPVAAVEKRKLC